MDKAKGKNPEFNGFPPFFFMYKTALFIITSELKKKKYFGYLMLNYA